jgi:hypothetical protein
MSAPVSIDAYLRFLYRLVYIAMEIAMGSEGMNEDAARDPGDEARLHAGLATARRVTFERERAA